MSKRNIFRDEPTSIQWVCKEELGYNGDFDYDPNNPTTITTNYNFNIIKRTPKLIKCKCGKFSSKRNLHLKIQKNKEKEYVEIGGFTISADYIVSGDIGTTIIQDGVTRKGKKKRKKILKKK